VKTKVNVARGGRKKLNGSKTNKKIQGGKFEEKKRQGETREIMSEATSSVLAFSLFVSTPLSVRKRETCKA